MPGLVLAWSSSPTDNDRASFLEPLTVGRSSSCRWSIPDRQLSRRHFHITKDRATFFLEDLESLHGTFFEGARVEGRREINPGALVRAGNCLFVVVEDLGSLGPQGQLGVGALAGAFHAAPLSKRLRIAALTGKSLLLSGESGSGKELAAQLMHEALIKAGRGASYVAYNGACFANEDDAVSSLFGIASGAFTGVSTRQGALQQAAGGTLFLDEVHNLPIRVQRTLLRFLEDGLFKPIGESTERRLDVRLILGTNVDVHTSIDEGRLAHDLVSRLQHVHVPALRHRRADIPSIFQQVLTKTISPEATTDAMVRCLKVTDMERLCKHDYRVGNVRVLEQMAAFTSALLIDGEPPEFALRAALDELLPRPDDGSAESRSPKSVYTVHRTQIIDIYRENEGNLTKVVADLKATGINVNRRWLAEFLERWGIRPIKRGS